MSKALEEITREAVRLPRDQRLALARVLIELDEPAADNKVQAAWDAEIRERVRAVEDGAAEGISYDQVLARIDRHLTR